MFSLPTRQVHLDFHTSELIPGVGSRFDSREFQDALKTGHINSVTVFAKCHHSWSYYPTEAGRVHPTLESDLLGSMMEAAHGINVKAPVYITVGWSAGDAEENPQWAVKDIKGNVVMTEGRTDGGREEKRPNVSWKFLCPNGGYDRLIYAQTREICMRYPRIDGLFYDICFGPDCWCEACVKGMKEMGLDPEITEHAKRYNRLKWEKFCESCRGILFEKNPEASVFFNGGAVIYTLEWHKYQSHFEMEDLPTTWGGYDKLPVRAKYFAATGKPILGMTGKFHTMWGEFGGFKTAEAMKYECASIMAYGACCSIGDQLHPGGKADPETYRLIGEAYRYAEEIEPWCFDTEETSRLGVFLSGDSRTDEGLARMLLENHMDFRVLTGNEELAELEAVILPDCTCLDMALYDKLNRFIESGGGVVLTGESGLCEGKRAFMLDTGARYMGRSIYENDYLLVGEGLKDRMVLSPILFYEAASMVDIKDGEMLAEIYEPYFNRTYGHYCSHQNTPYRQEPAAYPGALRKGNVVYAAHPVCRIYYEHGAQFHRQYFINALRLVYKEPVLDIKLPSSGRVHLARQEKHDRYVLHVLYAPIIPRGRALVIEDFPPIYRVKVRIRCAEKIRRVCLAPGGQELPFVREGNTVAFEIPEVECHRMVALEY